MPPTMPTGAWAEIRETSACSISTARPTSSSCSATSLPTTRASPASAPPCSPDLSGARWSARFPAGNPLFVRDGVLLARDRERIAGRDWSDAHDLPRRGPLIPRLQALAYAMQERSGGSDGKQVMVTLDEALAHLNHARAEDLLQAGTQLAVLDEERKTDRVRFSHQLLQEYFAARQLAAQPAPAAELARSEWRADRIKPSLADKLATLQDFEPLPPPDPTGWEETTILAASMAADPDAFARALAEPNLELAARCVAALRATNRAQSPRRRDAPDPSDGAQPRPRSRSARAHRRRPRAGRSGRPALRALRRAPRRLPAAAAGGDRGRVRTDRQRRGAVRRRGTGPRRASRPSRSAASRSPMPSGGCSSTPAVTRTSAGGTPRPQTLAARRGNRRRSQAAATRLPADRARQPGTD
jgi:hypothetical protein